MSKIERRVYNKWAFTEQEDLKGKINQQIYRRLMKKYRCAIIFPSEVGIYNTDTFDLILIQVAGFAHSTYSIYHNTTHLSDDEIMLICDRGNLCFGGHREGGAFIVEED